MDEIVRPGDVLKILRPAFDQHRFVNVADHVMLVIKRPQPVALIEVERSRGPAGARAQGRGQAPAPVAKGAALYASTIGVYEVQCLESSNEIAHIERRTYWIVANPVDCHLAIINPQRPADTGEWERIMVLNSPLKAADEAISDTADDVLASQDQRRVRMDWKAFQLAVKEVEQQQLSWSLMTATRAVMCKAHMTDEEYAGQAGRRRLVAEIRDLWERDPICTTVPIRVWQRYLFLVWQGDDVAAADEVLRLMPCRGDRTLPSVLWRVLREETGLWKEVKLSQASWGPAWESTGTTSTRGEVLPRVGVAVGARGERPWCRRHPSGVPAGLRVYRLDPDFLGKPRSGCSCRCSMM